MEQYNGIGYHNNKVKENDKKMASSGSHQAFSSKSYSFNSFRLLRYTLYRTPPLDNSNSRCNLPHLHVFILHIIMILMFICIISFDSSPRNTSIVPVGRYFFYTDCISLCTYLVEVVGCTVGTIFIFITSCTTPQTLSTKNTVTSRPIMMY